MDIKSYINSLGTFNNLDQMATFQNKINAATNFLI